jgi:multiple sugar transport system permease protein
MAVQVEREQPLPSARASSILTQLRERLRRRTVMGPLAKRRERWFYLMISPWLIGFIAFQAGPIIAAGLLSFNDYSLTRGATWVGLKHYETLLADPLAIRTFWNTAYYAFVSVPLGIVVAFVLAILLNQKLRGINVFRTIFFVPAVVEGVAVYMLWGWIFNPRFGLINALLDLVGIRGPAWLASENWAMPAMIIISLWRVGWMMLIYLAGLQDIPQEYYEASEIDGASRWQMFWHITIPLISPVTFFLFVTGLIFAMQIFTPLYVLTRGGPNNSTMTLSLLIFFAAITFDRMGYASALAMLLFMVILLITLAQFLGARRWVHYTSEEVH